ncbi:chaperone modulator CbpM [Quatrionicoccus australiensis]|uniref:chaperone modulator CbpM n=1 Tax=Quatrionicoccus australiensis TaxID=138118 RepID=UPI001CF84C63|nr:chaperone modulator CbpM [Quatrionicoccus australiensis]UCV16910.1 hypothetical protein KI612_09675 [Quatrionicoccus australiensis]
MSRQLSEAVWLNDTAVCDIEHLAEVSGLSIGEVNDLVDIGVIVPSGRPAGTLVFQLCQVLTVKRARRLRDDFQLDHHGVALALTLIRRIGELQAELDVLRHPGVR